MIFHLPSRLLKIPTLIFFVLLSPPGLAINVPGGTYSEPDNINPSDNQKVAQPATPAKPAAPAEPTPKTIPSLPQLIQQDEVKRRELINSLPESEIRWINKNPPKILSLYRRSIKADEKGVVLIFHAPLSNVNDRLVIAPLRKFLANLGYSTLSVEMPYYQTNVTDKLMHANQLTRSEHAEEIYQSYKDMIFSRFEAALNEAVVDTMTKKVVVIGHGVTAALLVEYFNNKNKKSVEGLVLISAHWPTNSSESSLTKTIPKLPLPVLEVAGTLDSHEVLSDFQVRAAMALQQDKTDYTQKMIKGADHQFYSTQGLLSRTIYGWIDNRVK